MPCQELPPTNVSFFFVVVVGQLEAMGAETVSEEKGVTFQELHQRAECWLLEASSEVPDTMCSLIIENVFSCYRECWLLEASSEVPYRECVLVL